VLGVGTAFLTPAVFAAYTPPSRGSAAGTASIFIDTGLSGGPIILGLIAAASSIPAAFIAAAGLTAAGTALLAARPDRAGPVPTGPATS